MIKVLLVDDDAMEMKLFEAFLSRCTAVVDLYYCETVDEAIEKAREVEPDLIFLDDRLPPHMSCETSIPVLREAGVTTPIAVISAAIDQFNHRRYLDMGATVAIDKCDINADSIGPIIEAQLETASAA